jgi:hypothetical protein
MTKDFLKDLDAMLRNFDKKYRTKIAQETNLSRARVNVFFQGSANEAIAKAIQAMLIQIKVAKEAAIQKEKAAIKSIQKMYEHF